MNVDSSVQGKSDDICKRGRYTLYDIDYYGEPFQEVPIASYRNWRLLNVS